MTIKLFDRDYSHDYLKYNGVKNIKCKKQNKTKNKQTRFKLL